MTTYQEELRDNPTYVGNVIIYFLGEYFSLHTPDSGLFIKEEYRGLVSSLVTNPTSIDPRRVNTTIAENSFKLLDKNGVLSALNLDTGEDIAGQPVEIFIGRSGVGMDFADYLPLPKVYARRISKVDSSYTFSAVGESDRMNRAIYQTKTRVSGAIFAATTSFTAKDDISLFPSSGIFRIEKEFISYAAKDDGTKTFTGLVRGLFGTTPADHDDDNDVGLADFPTGNPIDILIQLLVSSGGGSAYDVLQDGVALDSSLVDIADMESVRDALYSSAEFSLGIYAVDNALTFIENELLMPNNLRFTYSENAKLTVAVLDKAKFVDSIDVIDEDTLTKVPTWDSDTTKIVNNIQISWDYNEDTGKFGKIETFRDSASIAAYGLKDVIDFEWRGVKSANAGAALVSKFKTAYFSRLSIPSPEVAVKTHMDKSLLNVGNKSVLKTRYIPNELGQLNFNSELEVISRGINWQTGDVTLKLQFTSFTGVRSCYLAPSDTLVGVTSQKIVSLGAGRGLYYEAGWKLRLWDNIAKDYTADPVNTIASIAGDVVTFQDNFATTLTTNHRLKFCNYDDATDEQKRYCFANTIGAANFADGGKTYKVVP